MQLGYMLPSIGSAKTIRHGAGGHVRPELLGEAACPRPPARMLAWQVVRLHEWGARMIRSESFAWNPELHTFFRAKNGDATQSAGNGQVRTNAEQGARCCPNQS
jgi:hypothetical protein